MVNPGGTGNPALVISARPAPLPPRSSFILPLPSALPPPKKKTYLVALLPLGLPLLPDVWISVSGGVDVAIMSPCKSVFEFWIFFSPSRSSERRVTRKPRRSAPAGHRELSPAIH